MRQLLIAGEESGKRGAIHAQGMDALALIVDMDQEGNIAAPPIIRGLQGDRDRNTVESFHSSSIGLIDKALRKRVQRVFEATAVYHKFDDPASRANQREMSQRNIDRGD